MGLNEILSVLDKAQERFSYEIFVPSIQKNVRFREITTAQQKRLIKSVIDSSVYNSEFILTLRDILDENCIDKDVNINSLTIYDKLLISIYMRMVNIGDDLGMTFKCPDCEKTHEFVFKLSSLFTELNKIKHDFECVIRDTNGAWKVTCRVPTIGDEYALEKEMRRDKEVKTSDTKQMRDFAGDVFITEISKYVAEVEYTKEDGEVLIIDMSTLTFKDRIKIIERLSAKLLDKIMEFTSSIKKAFDGITLVKFNCSCEKKTLIEQRFSIDSNFFINS